MLVFLSNPVGTVKLDLATERWIIEQALGEVSGISVEFCPDATLEMLQDALVYPAHIFHFAGHGKFEGDLRAACGSIAGTGYLVFVDNVGQEMLVSAEKLALSLQGRGVRLAVLGACEGGRRDQVNAWTGVVSALTRAGIPAVVGMQCTIRDQNAIAFSRRFYRALAAGQPIDAAVTDGRLAIFNRGGDAERDWGVPVLYLRTDEEVLFPSARPARLAETRGEPQGRGLNIRVDQHVGTVAGGRVVGVQVGQPSEQVTGAARVGERIGETHGTRRGRGQARPARGDGRGS